MKIKEGLAWNSSTDELIVFIDHGNDDKDCSDMGSQAIATHVLQFQFKSLFSTFTFPCAFFFTRAPKAHEIHDMFWQGVQHLHEYGFRVILCCCDGAVSNRAFMQMNSLPDHPGQTINTYGNWPLFFISDPTYLIKKLRNNLSMSGYHSSCTRTLRLNGQPVLWRHIREVYDRDKSRPLHFTPLREEHVSLTSLSRMRSRLAYDIFNERVQDEMCHFLLAEYFLRNKQEM